MTSLISVFLPAAMMVLMASLGLRLHPRELVATLRRPRALGAGLAVQMIGLPLAAFGIAHLFGLSAGLAAGLMLVAASPGGVSSNYITHLARGRVALSVAMTLTTSLAAPVTLPLVLALCGIATPSPTALLRISFSMTLVALAPLTIGMILAHLAPVPAARIERRLAPVAKAIFMLMVLATFAQNWEAMRGAFVEAGPAVIALALAAPALAFTAALVLHLSRAERRTIAIEASLQNVAITIFVAGPILDRPLLALPGLIYSVSMNVVALGLLALDRAGPITDASARGLRS